MVTEGPNSQHLSGGLTSTRESCVRVSHLVSILTISLIRL
jgi:hypothetical protein